MIGTHNIHRVVEAVEQTLLGNTIYISDMKKLPELNLPKVRNNDYVEILIISTGCLGRCTFCKTRYARGKLRSQPIDAVMKRVAEIMENPNIKEIWISSEDVGAYGLDIGTTIVELLQSLINVLPSVINSIIQDYYVKNRNGKSSIYLQLFERPCTYIKTSSGL